MPLARVIAASAKAAEPVADWLAQHGYQVETAYPEEPRNQDCDFEIFVEQFSAEEALQHAQQLAERLNCNVLIAPGALQSPQPDIPEPAPQLQPKFVLPAKPPAAPEITTKTVGVQENANVPRATGARRTPDVKEFSVFVRRFVSQFVSKPRARAAASVASFASVSHAHARKIGAQVKELEQRNGPPLKRFSVRAKEQLAQARRNSSRWLVDVASYVSTSGQRLGTSLKAAAGALRQGAQIGYRQLSAWSRTLRNDWRHRYEQRQQAKLRVAAQAQISAERSLRELQAEPSETMVPAPQPVLSVKLASPSVVNGNGEINHQPHASRERDWQMALVGAAIMASVIMFALGFFTRSADSAGATVTAGAPQAVPKVVKATVGPAAAGTASPSLQSAHIESALPPAANVEAQPKPTAGGDRAAHTRVRAAARSTENDDINDGEPDVVVRHLTPKTQQQSAAPAKTVAGVKQYSDME